MTRYVAPVTRKNGMAFGKPTHWYVDATGEKIPGVTTLISNGLPKPALTRWAAKTTAAYAVDRWDELSELRVAERLKTLEGAAWAERDAAAGRGTAIHDLAERLAHGEQVDVPDELAGHVESAVRFLDDHQPKVILAEKACYNLEYGWAGTFDLIAQMPDGRTALIDYKTSKNVYGDVGLQLAAYAACTHYVADDGEQLPMPHIDWCGVVHIRADGYSLYPVRADDYVLTRMRHVAVVARLQDETRAWLGEELSPDQEAM